MIRRLITIFVFLQLSLTVRGQDYSVSGIADSLKLKADAVVRKHVTRISVAVDGYHIQENMAVTVFNDNLEEALGLYLYESNDVKADFISGNVYNGAGQLVHKIKKSELIQVGDFSNFSSDAKFLVYPMPEISFPYTLEYTCETTVGFHLTMPAWTPAPAYRVAVESATLEVTETTAGLYRYLEQMLTPAFRSGQNGNTRTWRVTGLKPIPGEEHAVPAYLQLPTVLLAPGKISYDGYIHDFSRWDDLGAWIKQLNQGKETLTEPLKKQVHQLTDSIPDKLRKIRALYAFMQDNTRYISIQYGIGGFQPFSAGYVHEKGYGDCKALSNYMYAMLKEAGIEAYYTLVKAGENNNIIAEFPASQFNHVIVCVPLSDTDTLWLENTAQAIPFGFNGAFTDDRDVLVICDKPRIVHTNIYTANDNRIENKIQATVSPNGEIMMQVDQRCSGLFYNQVYPIHHASSTVEREKYLQHHFGLANAEILAHTLREIPERIPAYELQTAIRLANAAKSTSNRIFMPAIPFRNIPVPVLDSTRQYPFFESMNYTLTDSIYLTLPEAYNPDSPLTETSFNARAGSYRIKTSRLDDGRILVVRTMTIHKGIYTREHFAELTEFYKKIRNAEGQLIILKKNS